MDKPYGYVVEMSGGHKVFFIKEPKSFLSDPWIGLAKVIPLYEGRQPENKSKSRDAKNAFLEYADGESWSSVGDAHMNREAGFLAGWDAHKWCCYIRRNCDEKKVTTSFSPESRKFGVVYSNLSNHPRSLKVAHSGKGHIEIHINGIHMSPALEYIISPGDSYCVKLIGGGDLYAFSWEEATCDMYGRPI